jgi:hypothetical protein
MKHEAAENRKYVYHGEISPAMWVRLERGTAPEIVPRHHLHKDCKFCRNCPICYEAAPGYFIKLATRTFQQALPKVRIQDLTPPLLEAGIAKYAEYAYSLGYIMDPTAPQLPVNFETALCRHKQLRANFAKLGQDTKDEFTLKLNSGRSKGYWRILEDREFEKMRQKEN